MFLVSQEHVFTEKKTAKLCRNILLQWNTKHFYENIIL